mgnify:CR=1 FL=1
MTARIRAVRTLMERLRLDGILLSGRPATAWLSGFSGSTSQLLVTRQAAWLVVDFRYVLAAQRQATAGIEVVTFQDSYPEALERLLSRHGIRHLGFEGDALTVSEYERFRDRLRTPSRYLALSVELSELRARKDAEELHAIRTAAGIADAVYAEILPLIRPGMVESILAAEIEYRMRRHGAQGAAFPTIVASGPNAALPHAEASDRAFMTGDAILMDFGAKHDGYCSDMTRTVFLGEPPEVLRTIYGIVLGAQRAALAAIRPGMTGCAADAIARRIITDAGYGNCFGHSLGHGVGLEIHEEPRLSVPSKDVLEAGMVFTVEPGIYIEGVGGVRIEDMGVLAADGFASFTRTPTELLVLPV